MSAVKTPAAAVEVLEELGARIEASEPLPLPIGPSGIGRGGCCSTAQSGNHPDEDLSQTNRVAVSDSIDWTCDDLLADDCPQVIPSGESKLIWLEAKSRGARPGLYDFKVTVRVGDARHAIPLRIQVHDVVLSEETPLWTGNWSDLHTGDGGAYTNLREVREAMFSQRITIGTMTSYSWPGKDDQGRVIRPRQLDFTDLDKTLIFHKDFPRITFFAGFNQHIDPPQRDRFGPVEWMSDEFKEIFRE